MQSVRIRLGKQMGAMQLIFRYPSLLPGLDFSGAALDRVLYGVLVSLVASKTTTSVVGHQTVCSLV